MSFESTCHCGKLKAVVDEDMPTRGMTCNCSICRRKGTIHHFTTHDKVELTRPEDATGDYTFNHHAIHHHHCKDCGCAPFATGKGPDGKEMVEINLRCVKDCDLDKLELTEFDGAKL